MSKIDYRIGSGGPVLGDLQSATGGSRQVGTNRKTDTSRFGLVENRYFNLGFVLKETSFSLTLHLIAII
jgi:hypothetical protein